MLSRVAERLYWFGRYLERAESTARLLSVYTNLVLDVPNVQFLWPALVQITGYEDAFQQRFKHANERNVVQFLLDDPRCSLRFCVNQARENVRTSRDLMPNEAWEKMNELHLLLQQNDLGRISRDNRFNLLSNVIDLCLELTGYLSGSLSRQPPHYFLKIERSSNHSSYAVCSASIFSPVIKSDPANSEPRLLRAYVKKRVVGRTQSPHDPTLSAARGVVASTAISRLIGNVA